MTPALRWESRRRTLAQRIRLLCWHSSHSLRCESFSINLAIALAITAGMVDVHTAFSQVRMPDSVEMHARRTGTERTSSDATGREPGPSDIPRADMELLRSDCDGNGIPDTVDIRAGATADANQNDIDDWCDPDSVVRAAAQDTVAWTRKALAGSALSLWTRYSRSDHIDIRVVTPSPHTFMTVGLFGPSGKRIADIYRAIPGRRALSFHWKLRQNDGKPIPEGVYLLKASVGERHQARTVEWRE